MVGAKSPLKPKTCVQSGSSSSKKAAARFVDLVIDSKPRRRDCLSNEAGDWRAEAIFTIAPYYANGRLLPRYSLGMKL